MTHSLTIKTTDQTVWKIKTLSSRWCSLLLMHFLTVMIETNIFHSVLHWIILRAKLMITLYGFCGWRSVSDFPCLPRPSSCSPQSGLQRRSPHTETLKQHIALYRHNIQKVFTSIWVFSTFYYSKIQTQILDFMWLINTNQLIDAWVFKRHFINKKSKNCI